MTFETDEAPDVMPLVDAMLLIDRLWDVYEAAGDACRWLEENGHGEVAEAKLLRRELDTLERVVEDIKSTRPEPCGPACAPSQVGGGPETVK
jgi:hypothetical protein